MTVRVGTWEGVASLLGVQGGGPEPQKETESGRLPGHLLGTVVSGQHRSGELTEPCEASWALESTSRLTNSPQLTLEQSVAPF